MSDEVAPEPEDDASAVVPRRTRASSAENGDPQPVGRALLSRSAGARDWADTGDPDYEPALEGESAGHADDPDGAPVSPPEDGTAWERPGEVQDGASVASLDQDTVTVVLAEGAFAQADPVAADPSGTGPAATGSVGTGSVGTGEPAPAATWDRRDRTAAAAREEWSSDRASARDRLAELTAAAAAGRSGSQVLRAQDDGDPADGDPADGAPVEGCRSVGDRDEGAPTAADPDEGDATTATPDVPAGEAIGGAPKRRTRGAAPRQPMLLQGLLPALVGAALLVSSTLGVLPLAVAVLAVQVFLILGALALLDAPAAGGAFLVAAGAVVVADVVVLLDEGSVSGLAAVAGLGFVAALGHQLARRGRSRVTESLADTLVVLVVGVSAACLLALHEVTGGRQVLQVSLAAAGAVLLAGRVGDHLAPRPVLAIGSTRGWPGLVLGLLAGVVAAGVIAQLADQPPLRSAVLLGLVVASTVATADLAVDLGAAELRSGWRDARRVAALRPTALLLPFAVLGPVALLAGRLLLT